ncbi:hypothetical protein Tco_0424096 [Tanacetum coccineum]
MILPEHPSETKVFHNEDGNPARANIQQAVGRKVGHWKRNCPVYLDELIKKKKQVDTANSSDIFTIELLSFLNKSWVHDTGCDSKKNVLYFNVILSDGIYEIDMLNLVPNVNSICNDSCFITFMDDYSRYGYVYLLRHKHEVFETFKDYAIESVTRIINMVLTKKVNKTPYELRYGKVPNMSLLKGLRMYAEFLEKNLISQEVSGRAVELEEIQDEDTSPSENTTEIPMEVEGFEPPQEEVVPVRVTPCQGRNMRRKRHGYHHNTMVSTVEKTKMH